MFLIILYNELHVPTAQEVTCEKTKTNIWKPYIINSIKPCRRRRYRIHETEKPDRAKKQTKTIQKKEDDTEQKANQDRTHETDHTQQPNQVDEQQWPVSLAG